MPRVGLSGCLPSVFLAWRELSYRGVPKKLRIVTWTPLHWLLLSVAGWCAARELIVAPSHWNKTEHGLDGGDRAAHALINLYRHIADLQRRGELPQIWTDATDNVADRQRPLLAAV